MNRKNLSSFILLLILGMVIGSLGWELLERLFRQLGVSFSLTLKAPLQILDLYVVSLSLRANPGTLLGALGGIVLFRLI